MSNPEILQKFAADVLEGVKDGNGEGSTKIGILSCLGSTLEELGVSSFQDDIIEAMKQVNVDRASE